jgi:hypothetical protein
LAGGTIMKNPLRSLRFLEAYQRALGGSIAVLLLANMLVAGHQIQERKENSAPLELINEVASSDPTISPSQSALATGKNPKAIASSLPGVGPIVKGKYVGRFIPGVGTIPRGITNNQVRVVYYWKGDQTMSSQFINGTGAEGHDLDEANAFRTLVAYLNKYKNGGATFMGFPFNLHGRELVPYVEEAGKGAETRNKMVAKITGTIKPFAAVSSHGSLSTEICPLLSDAGVHNFSTYDLGGKGGTLVQRSGGYCLPSGVSFEQQVDTMVRYLVSRTDKSMFTRPGQVPQPRRYGLLYAEYRGLIDVIDEVYARLKKAGLNMIDKWSMPGDLTTAQTVAADRVSDMSDAGVNTVISPDSGALINFTHSAQAAGYSPDYAIWPCSGQDSTGMVRLYDPVQWSHARGLTCYDPEFDADLTKDDASRNMEWYKQYQEVAPGREPPAPTPLVYQGLLPLVVGLTNAGRQVTVESFRAGLNAFKPYRYSASSGRTTDAKNLLISMNTADRCVVGDVAEIYWDNLKRTPGAETQGAYVFTELSPPRRYARGAVF